MAKLKIRENKAVAEDYYLLKLIAPELLDKVKAGQFMNLRINNNDSFDPLLRRPLSIHDLDKESQTIDLLYRLVGRGTKILSTLKKGEEIDTLGPLGEGFTTEIKNKKLLVIGGGMGIAPLLYLSRILSPANNLTVIIGGNNASEMEYFCNKFQELDLNLRIATMDGSKDFCGNTVELWQDTAEFDFDYLYSCGPSAMMKAVQDLVIKYNIDGEVSLEEKMGCGIGLCLSCVCKSKEGNQRICKEGPVFSIKDIVFTDERCE
ncbi:dihydroorotate dehydrogenase electron transfer subunit [Natronospora cellulosivora (SeqCode)]